MKVNIVVDLGFGDSGKGLCVDYLVSRDRVDSLVVRFSGGHQVGHTVQVGERCHTFSNFGAGTLRGAPTYYSEFCTLFPPAMLAEAAHLQHLAPRVFVHPLVAVTTPYDVAYNRVTERVKQHGSCGVGFGATLMREAAGVCLHTKDLAFHWIMAHKLRAISDYYRDLLTSDAAMLQAFESELEGIDDAQFIDVCRAAFMLMTVSHLRECAEKFQALVFEGSQGIMLDQTHGLFPNVTPSNTTTANAFLLLSRLELTLTDPVDIYYLSRCYQTRHGNGPMSKSTPVILINNHNEANRTNPFQGSLRCTELDVELLQYAMCSDSVYHPDMPLHKNFLLTCLDQRPDFNWKTLLPFIDQNGFQNTYGSYGPTAENVELMHSL
ncbi:MAG TPA: adenylosuccinate synthase [Gammaproteobacteria bacterium]|mgnify:FL=1|nr:adenylosuccinate synthase [Pseudomonadales bacterium]MEC8812705.1 adenylosuccinate synthetase [Pseudomonadota bacterium]HAU15475.1 adenylosuccinate synthase [Gammaproteobacteria bacterium]HBO93598.1 adenylosuccinate synthase [Gammaproteobacteria bacterium]|tara:strand:- start:2157 stop:3293 length:1137 start_codon:yes stop_codon:yes gene_type:complete